MGEAKNRGTQSERVEQAEQREEAKMEAIETRMHADGLVWMVVQSAPSIIEFDEDGVMVIDEEGSPAYIPDEDNWESLRQDDVPDWVMTNEIIGDLREGKCVGMHVNEGGRWYRGLICSPTEEDTVH